MTVVVPAPVAKGLDAIKKRRSCNMMDIATVILEANELGFYETARWLEQNGGVYQKALEHGYVSDGEDGGNRAEAKKGAEFVEREVISETGSEAVPVVEKAKPTVTKKGDKPK